MTETSMHFYKLLWIKEFPKCHKYKYKCKSKYYIDNDYLHPDRNRSVDYVLSAWSLSSKLYHKKKEYVNKTQYHKVIQVTCVKCNFNG